MSATDAANVIADGMREVATEGRNGTPGTRDDGQLWGAFPNTMTLMDLAAHVVSKLTDAGYSIVQLPKPEATHTLKSGLSYQSFPVWPSNSPVIAFSDGSVEFDDVGDMSAADAREAGLALIAAAAVAEGEKPETESNTTE